MKIKNKKKHQKPLISLSILLLFLLVLNINNTFTFEDIESEYTEDNIKENFEGLNPEIIIESPKNADYLNNLDFMPYGMYIYAPKYIQRFVGQTDLNDLYFRPYDAIEGGFYDFEVYVNGTLDSNINWNGYTFYFNINTYIQTSGIYNITAQARSERTDEWITHYSILNVTDTSPSIGPFYDDFMKTQYNWGYLEWNTFTSNSRNFNYTIYINDTEVYFEDRSYFDNYIYFEYTSYEDFDAVGSIFEIKLKIIDETDEETINQFEIRVVANNNPYIMSFESNCYQLTLWETEGFKLQIRADANQEVLEKIVVLVNSIPFHTIFNAKRNTLYEVPISTNLLNKIGNEYNFDYYMEFRAIAITNIGRFSDLYSSQSQNIELRYNNYPELIVEREDINSGRNIETLEIIDNRNSNINYSLTVVTDVLSPTTLTIASSNGEAYQNSQYFGEHCYEDNTYEDENYNCNIFGGFDTDNDWYTGGMVFWVSAENQSAVNFPMIVKIAYPEEMQPDGLNKIWNLQFMHWVDNCVSNERGWFIYRNESITENRDERLINKGDNEIEVLIYSHGLYAFGIEPGNEDNNRGFFISSFPIGLFIFSFGIAISTIFLKSKLKIKKK